MGNITTARVKPPGVRLYNSRTQNNLTDNIDIPSPTFPDLDIDSPVFPSPEIDIPDFNTPEIVFPSIDSPDFNIDSPDFDFDIPQIDIPEQTQTDSPPYAIITASLAAFHNYRDDWFNEHERRSTILGGLYDIYNEHVMGFAQYEGSCFLRVLLGPQNPSWAAASRISIEHSPIIVPYDIGSSDFHVSSNPVYNRTINIPIKGASGHTEIANTWTISFSDSSFPISVLDYDIVGNFSFKIYGTCRKIQRYYPPIIYSNTVIHWNDVISSVIESSITRQLSKESTSLGWIQGGGFSVRWADSQNPITYKNEKTTATHMDPNDWNSIITSANKSVEEYSQSNITVGVAGIDDVYAVGYTLEDIQEKWKGMANFNYKNGT